MYIKGKEHLLVEPLCLLTYYFSERQQPEETKLKMFAHTLTPLLALASVATAHFSVEYPPWRGDSFQTGASQYIYPCTSLPSLPSPFPNHPETDPPPGANVNQTASTNRTLWHLTGGSLALDLHHPWTYIFVNLALGTISASFNISLTQQPLNETGNGTLCLPQLTLPAGFTAVEGQNASLQVVTLGQSGSALYNVSLRTL